MILLTVFKFGEILLRVETQGVTLNDISEAFGTLNRV